MKNLKKIALSLLVVGLAVGFSAFKGSSLPPGDVFVTLDGTNYTLISQTDFKPEFCVQEPNIQCSYAITQVGIDNGLTTFSASNAASYLTMGYVTVVSPERKGIYDPGQ